MTGLADAAGTVGEGAIWARTVEPRAGEAGAGPHGATCLNCGARLVGRYCHACGQSSHVHRTLMSIVHDLLHGVFHFEGKIWRTIPMLVVHPGQLTRRYIDGERARFVSPLALFLFTVFLMFASFSALGGADFSQGIADGWNSVPTAELEKAQVKAKAELAEAVAARSRLAAAGQPTAKADRRVANLKEDADTISKVKYRLDAPTGDSIKVTSKFGWLDARLQEARKNPGLVIYKVQSAAYKFSWALIFLSTPMVALLFLWRRKYGLYDHATFVTYSITFMSFLAIVVTVLAALPTPKGVIGCLVAFAPPAHMFVQLRGAYRLRWFSALWRTVALMFFALIALTLFTVGVVALEVAH